MTLGCSPRTALMLFVAVLASCLPQDPGDDTATGDPVETPVSELCAQEVKVTCRRMVECYTASELAIQGYPDSVGECSARLETEIGCAKMTEETLCVGTQAYSAAEERKCIEQIEEASCDQIKIGRASGDPSAYAPACERVCSVP